MEDHGKIAFPIIQAKNLKAAVNSANASLKELGLISGNTHSVFLNLPRGKSIFYQEVLIAIGAFRELAQSTERLHTKSSTAKEVASEGRHAKGTKKNTTSARNSGRKKVKRSDNQVNY